MKFNNKKATELGSRLAESYFGVFSDPINRGPNFTWENFRSKILPHWVDLHLWQTIGTSKNWKHYLPVAIKAADDKCVELFITNDIKY